MGPTPDAAPPSPSRAAAVLRVVERVARCAFIACLAVGSALALARLARYALATRFDFDDWEWLDRGRDLGQLIEDQVSLQWEVFRPIPQYLYAASVAWFGANPIPLAALFLGVHVAGALVVALVFRAIGLSPIAAALGALAALFDPITAESFTFLSLNQVALSRLLMAATMLCFLGKGRRPRALWFPLAVLAIGTHEQSVLMAPLLLLCFWFRDGLRGALRSARHPEVIALLVICVAYVGFRFATRDPTQSGSHALGFSALPDKLRVFVGHHRVFCGRFRGFSRPIRLAIIAAGVAHWVLRRRLFVARVVVFGGAWAVVAYAPYFLAIHETAGYHFNLSLIGLAITIGAFLDHCTSAQMGFLPFRLFWMGFALPFVLPRPGPLPRRQADSGAILDLVRRGLQPEREGLTRLIFVEKQPSERGHGEAPFYLNAMAGEFAWNREHGDGQNHALRVAFPERSFRVWVLEAAMLPHLCARPGDLVLGVEVHRFADWHPEYSFSPIAPCSDGATAHLPPALDGPSGTPAAGPDADLEALRGAARAYWRAYGTFDTDRSQSAARDALGRAQRLSGGPGAPAARLLVEPIRATQPPVRQ